MAWAIVAIVLTALCVSACVLVTGRSSYTRNDSVDQGGTNNRAVRIDIDPK